MKAVVHIFLLILERKFQSFVIKYSVMWVCGLFTDAFYQVGEIFSIPSWLDFFLNHKRIQRLSNSFFKHELRLPYDSAILLI